MFPPQTGNYSSLIEEAAEFWESLSQNHPFIDGNERTAFAATYFSLINGLRIVATSVVAQVFVFGSYESVQLKFESPRAWLADHTRAM